ncbi:MAG: DUF421 domain-containing protein [Ruminococcus sp.]|nr:DUF421 domain-containing protein [Ruminococcus sp.]
MDILKTAITSSVSIIALFILTKLMGNKQVSQLSMFDYIIGISIGSIAAEFSTELENPENTLAAMIIYAVIAYLVSVVTQKSTHMRKLIVGRPMILFDNGKLYRKNFKKARIDISDFLTHCRIQGYFDLSKIRTAIFEYNGSISILPVDENRPLEPSDMNIKPTQQEILVNVIMDGNINDKNLKTTGNDKTWLQKQLHNHGFHNEKEVFLGLVNTVDNTMLLYSSDIKDKTTDPFE